MRANGLRGALDPQRPARPRTITWPASGDAIRAGVTLVNGTDIPPGDLVDGIPAAVHELLLMAAAGLSPLLSLQSVSVNAAALARHRRSRRADPARLRGRLRRRGRRSAGRPRRAARRSRWWCRAAASIRRRTRRRRMTADAPVHRRLRVAGAGRLQPRRPPRERRHGQRDHRHRPGRGRAAPRRHRRPGPGVPAPDRAGADRAGGGPGRRGPHGGVPRARRQLGAGRATPTATCSRAVRPANTMLYVAGAHRGRLPGRDRGPGGGGEP